MYVAIGLCFVIIAVFVACSKPVVPQTEIHMGTVCSINLYKQGSANLYKLMFTRIKEIENIFSVNIPTSEISLINKNAGFKAVPVSPEVIQVLDKALAIAKKTEGAFDPTIGPLVSLWGIGSDKARVPSQAEIDRAISLIDYTKLKINHAEKTVYLEEKDMAIDLGGIVKGYAADELVRIAKEHHITQAIFDLGGNIYTYGAKAHNSPWNIGIKNPEMPAGAPVIKIQLINQSVVTSGAYERFFEKDNKIYHHILNTKTVYPHENEVRSSTIVSNSSMLADALSTSTYLLGAKKAIELLETEDAEGIIICKDHSIVATSGITKKMTILNEDFQFK